MEDIYYSQKGSIRMSGYTRIAAFVNLKAVEANLEAVKAGLNPYTKVAAVVKTDAYGHGAEALAEYIEEKEYLWGFATAMLEEALQLARAGIRKPLLILGYVYPEDYQTIAELVEEKEEKDGGVLTQIRPAVYSFDTAEGLSKAAARQSALLGKQVIVPVHIKVDTGMSRIGFRDDKESIAQIQRIAKLPHIRLEGLFTHFARADEADKTSVNRQISRFRYFEEACREAGLTFPVCHCANSAGSMESREAQWDMVRAGIILYGLYPSQEVRKETLKLKPVMTLKSRIVQIKEIEPGTEVSYGGIYKADSIRRIATIPVGYGDGYPRSLSNKGCVLICGKRAPIRGRVCMDQMMVDVTEIPEAEQGMEVILFGKDKEEELSLEELCEWSGRFNYEFVCDINKRVPRIYVEQS